MFPHSAILLGERLKLVQQSGVAKELAPLPLLMGQILFFITIK